MSSSDYVIRVLSSPSEVDACQWNELLVQQRHASPFMRHEYLAALHETGCASPSTGWTPRFITLWRRSVSAVALASPDPGETLAAACVVYIKDHSYGEYVFDWAWANAYAQHGLDYYPKAVVAVPFTPVPGARLLAQDTPARQALVNTLLAWCGEEVLSSLHVLFASEEDVAACASAGMMLRHTVQFHWENDESIRADGLPGYRDFDDFLATLSQDKRKKIRQERRKVMEAGVSFRCSLGTDISPQDWDFFYRCYERTYLEHGNAPYLNREFFHRMASTMPENWLLFVAEREENGTRRPIATSLIALSSDTKGGSNPFDAKTKMKKSNRIAFGRYWGALERVDCLHFEACYYQPLQWCIMHGYQRFEGGAQGEHKMARALLPVKTTSAHWLTHPDFSDAVDRFLKRESEGIARYMSELGARSPFRQKA